MAEFSVIINLSLYSETFILPTIIIAGLIAPNGKPVVPLHSNCYTCGWENNLPLHIVCQLALDEGYKTCGTFIVEVLCLFHAEN
jgi:hypothetical protein